MTHPNLAIEAKITRLLVNSPLSYKEAVSILKDVLEALYKPVSYEIVEEVSRA